MATITPATTYPAGQLNIAGHNANVFSTTTGQGIMSEPNGNLGIANLDPAFVVRDEHIMSEEAVMAKAETMTMPMDIYSNAFGIKNDTGQAYVPIGGLCQRVYIPFAASAVLWQWSFFAACFRPAITYDGDTQDSRLVELAMKLYIDGVEYPAFRRFLPCTSYFENAASESEFNYENVGANWFDITKLQQNVAAGYHELTIRLFAPRATNPLSETDEGPTFYTPVGLFGPNSPQTTCRVYTRVTYGNRSVRFVMFK
jgi:hypothetical protein